MKINEFLKKNEKSNYKQCNFCKQFIEEMVLHLFNSCENLYLQFIEQSLMTEMD